ncbi:hypothetical protein WJX73_009439 [Symbiochloris irregularis]
MTSSPLIVESEDDEFEVAKAKKRVGRPVIYRGDPDAAHLSQPERRQIKRRIVNRESARRVRERKQENVDGLRQQGVHASWSAAEAEKTQLQAENAALSSLQRQTCPCGRPYVTASQETMAHQPEFAGSLSLSPIGSRGFFHPPALRGLNEQK